MLKIRKLKNQPLRNLILQLHQQINPTPFSFPSANGSSTSKPAFSLVVLEQLITKRRRTHRVHCSITQPQLPPLTSSTFSSILKTDAPATTATTDADVAKSLSNSGFKFAAGVIHHHKLQAISHHQYSTLVPHHNHQLHLCLQDLGNLHNQPILLAERSVVRVRLVKVQIMHLVILVEYLVIRLLQHQAVMYLVE